MGKSLIIKGADFSANAVPVIPEGYMALTKENAVAQAQLYFNVSAGQLGVGDNPDDMLYWRLSAGSVLKLKASGEGTVYFARFAFLNDIYTVPTSYIDKLANGTTKEITIEVGDTTLHTYEITQDCVLTLYQFYGHLFPKILIYKP